MAFGSLFSDIHFIRTDDTVIPTEYQTIKVPLAYGPKEKWLVRNKQNPMPGTDDAVEMLLPRMSYEATGFTYDTSRKLTTTGRHVKALINDNTMLRAQFNPVPYNIGFVLHVMTKTVEDGLMIIEQILPFFTPDYTITVKDIPDLDLRKDINVVLNSVEHEDTWEGTFQERRTITWTLTFTAKAYLYPPVKLTKVNLETNVYYRIEGDDGISVLPSQTTTPSPSDSSAETVVDGMDTLVDASIRVMVLPSLVTLAAGESKTFDVTVLNATDTTFTVDVPTPTGTENDSYSLDIPHGTFTYTCGSGARLTQQTITIRFTSDEDDNQFSTITLVLEPA